MGVALDWWTMYIVHFVIVFVGLFIISLSYGIDLSGSKITLEDFIRDPNFLLRRPVYILVATSI